MSSITQAEIKQVRSLREKKFRDELGLFVVEGEKLVEEALRSGFEVVRVWRRDEIGEAAMARISQLSTPSPVLAVVRRPAAQEPPRPSGLCLALDGVRDPGNLGTILRIADWFGVETVYVSADCVELFNPKVIQASMGSVFRVRAVPAELPALARSGLARVRHLPGRARPVPGAAFPRGAGGDGQRGGWHPSGARRRGGCPPADSRVRALRGRVAQCGRGDGRDPFGVS